MAASCPIPIEANEPGGHKRPQAPEGRSCTNMVRKREALTARRASAQPGTMSDANKRDRIFRRTRDGRKCHAGWSIKQVARTKNELKEKGNQGSGRHLANVSDFRGTVAHVTL
jgi:hypothetical protein